MEHVILRDIEARDDAALAAVIRSCMEEFGVNRPNTVYFDPHTDRLSEVFRDEPRSHYFLATLDGKVLGGAGIYPTDQLPPDTCELVKMYLLPEARRMGLGGDLIGKCLEKARSLGYRSIYLESMPELTRAISVYERFGFRHLAGPLGNSGHSGCAVWMLKDIS